MKLIDVLYLLTETQDMQILCLFCVAHAWRDKLHLLTDRNILQDVCMYVPVSEEVIKAWPKLSGLSDINVVTTSLTRLLENLHQLPRRTLYSCHITRDDLIVGFVGEYQRKRDETEKPHEAALIVCGRKGKYQLSPEVQDMLQRLQGAPIMVSEMSTHATMSAIHKFTPKLNIHDTNRVGIAGTLFADTEYCLFALVLLRRRLFFDLTNILLAF